MHLQLDKGRSQESPQHISDWNKDVAWKMGAGSLKSEAEPEPGRAASLISPRRRRSGLLTQIPSSLV
jgi:hypothetical protein